MRGELLCALVPATMSITMLIQNHYKFSLVRPDDEDVVLFQTHCFPYSITCSLYRLNKKDLTSLPITIYMFGWNGHLIIRSAPRARLLSLLVNTAFDSNSNTTTATIVLIFK